MNASSAPVDVVMLGTFAAWNLGTLQARTLPFATALRSLGVQAAIVTTPWDVPSEAGTIDIIDGIPVINTSSTSPANPVAAVRQQIEWVQQLAPQVLHVFKPKGFGGFAGRLLSRSMTVLVDSDDWEGDGGWNDVAGYSFLQRRVFHHQEHDLIRNAAYVTAASTLLAERARSLRRSRETVFKLENGLERDWARQLRTARTHSPSQIAPPVIVLYSRFAEFDTDWVARFARHLNAHVAVPVTIRVIGDASSQHIPMVDSGTVHIELMGYVALGQIPTLLANATLAVYPYADSLVTRSKQSVKLLEQMAAGCPVVASDVGDIALTMGSAGVVLPDDAPEAFAREVVHLLDQPRRLDEMSAVGMTRIATHFGFDVLGQRLLSVYQAAGLH